MRTTTSAVWLAPPRGNGGEREEMDVDVDVDGGDVDSDEGVREWHFIPDDGDMADGVGEGWVEWRGVGQGGLDGRFVVHEVFRFGEEGEAH